jgi:hypothetical protein
MSYHCSKSSFAILKITFYDEEPGTNARNGEDGSLSNPMILFCVHCISVMKIAVIRVKLNLTPLFAPPRSIINTVALIWCVMV